MGPVAKRDAGGLASSEQIFAPPWKNVLDIVFGPLSIHSSPPWCPNLARACQLCLLQFNNNVVFKNNKTNYRQLVSFRS